MKARKLKNNLTVLILSTILLAAPHQSFVWEDGMVELDYYSMDPGFQIKWCGPFYDDHHFYCQNFSEGIWPVALVEVAADRSSVSVNSSSNSLPGCADYWNFKVAAGNHLFHKCGSPAKIAVNQFTGLTIGGTSINISSTNTNLLILSNWQYDCSPAIDRCYGYFNGPDGDDNFEVFGHDGISAYRHEVYSGYIMEESVASVGPDNQCVFSSFGNILFFVEFDGTSNLTLYPPTTLSGVRNVKMMRDGSYTLVQQVIGADRKVIKTTGTTFVQGDEIIMGPSYLGSVLTGELTTVDDSQYAIMAPYAEIDSSTCFFNHVTMSDVKYFKIRGIAPIFHAWPLKGSDASNFWVFMAVEDGTNGQIMLTNLRDPQPRCFTNCRKCNNATSCAICTPTFVLQGDNTCACPPGKGLNSATNRCVTCNTNCLTCNGATPNVCLSCRQYQTLTASDTCVCNTGFTPSGVNCVCNSPKYINAAVPGSETCDSCHHSCNTCVTSATNCLTCNTTDNFSFTGANPGPCSCAAGKLEVSQVCQNCTTPCATCSTTVSNCDTCSGTYQTTAVAGSCVCAANEFDNGSGCSTCHPSCSGCSGAATTCTACATNYVDGGSSTCICPALGFTVVGTSCLACNSNCRACGSGDINHCTQCHANATVDTGDNTCKCDAGFFMEADGFTCTACNDECQTCFNFNGSHCGLCAATFVSGGANVCVCPPGTTKVGSTCQACAHPCTECSGGSISSCTSCASNFFPSGNSCLCRDQDQNYLDGSGDCQSCDPSCGTCQTTATSCTSCTPPNILHLGACIASCPALNFFFDSGTNSCVACDPKCTKCSGSATTCSECAPGSILQGTQCLSGCPEGQFEDSGQCKNCGKNCKICTQETTCTTCLDEFTLDDSGACICPLGTKLSEDETNCIADFKGEKITIKDRKFFKDTLKISITFSQNLKERDFNSTLILSMINPTNKEKEIVKQTSTIYDPQNSKIDLFLKAFNRTIEGEILSITTTNSTIFESKKDDPKSFFIDFPIDIKIDYFVLGIEKAIAVVGQGASIASLATTGVLMAVSFNTALALVKLFQMLDFFIFLNVNMPSNLISFISFFDLNIFNLFPSVVEFDETGLECNLHPILIEKDVKCLGINNISDLLMQLFLLFIFKIFVAFLACILKERPKKNKVAVNPQNSPVSDTNRINQENKEGKDTKKDEENQENEKRSFARKCCGFLRTGIIVLNNKMDYSFYWAVLMSMEIDLFIGSWSTLKAYSSFSAPSMISVAILVILLLNYIFYGIVVAKGFFAYYLPKGKVDIQKSQIQKGDLFSKNEVQNVENEIKDYAVQNKNFLRLFEDIKEDSIYGVWILAIIAIKDLTLPFVIIYGINSAYMQIVPVIVIFIFATLFLIITKPYKSSRENWTLIFTYGMYIVGLTLFLVLAAVDQSISEKIKYMVLGNLLILVLLAIVLVNLIQAIVDGIRTFYEMIQNMRKKGTKEGDSTESMKDKVIEKDEVKAKKYNVTDRKSMSAFKQKMKNKLYSNKRFSTQKKLQDPEGNEQGANKEVESCKQVDLQTYHQQSVQIMRKSSQLRV